MDNQKVARELAAIARELVSGQGESRKASYNARFVDGMGRKIGNSKHWISVALRGNTSMVQTDDRRVVLLYDENNEEWDLNIDDGREIEKFHDEKRAIAGFFGAVGDLD